MFTDYLFNFMEFANVSTQNYTPLIATITGGVLTLITYIILTRSYKHYRIELLRVDSIHALVDVVAAIMASLGVMLTAYTKSTAIELLFTFILMLFVIHSMIEVFRNNIKTFTGGQLDTMLSIEIRKKLEEEINKDVSVVNVEARKLGSFYVVNVELAVDPDVTVLQLHRFRKRVVKVITGISELIYHVDVKFNPKYKWIEKRDRKISSHMKKHYKK